MKITLNQLLFFIIILVIVYCVNVLFIYINPNQSIQAILPTAISSNNDYSNNKINTAGILKSNDVCPFWENICVYNQHLRVMTANEEFDLLRDETPSQYALLGVNMKNRKESTRVYSKFFHATKWNASSHEYKYANCSVDNVKTHMILQAHYQIMLGEFYSRTLRYLHYLKDINHSWPSDDDVQLWLLIGDQMPVLTSHRLYTERYTKYMLKHLTSMMDSMSCKCYQVLMFCGFRKTKQDNHIYLQPQTHLLFINKDSQTLYPSMIYEYNKWINTIDINIDRDVRYWKYNQLLTNVIHGNVVNAKPLDINTVDEWRFIGLYDRKLRRKWMNVNDTKNNCNDKYNIYKIFCHVIILEDFLHSRDVIIRHRASNMLIGIHGAQLTDAIFMNKNGSYIIELLPHRAPRHASSLNRPTALGEIFWNSNYNHFGLKLPNNSIRNRPNNHLIGNMDWDKSDFYLDWNVLTDVIDFSFIDHGGVCNKYKHSDNISIPDKIQKYGFSIYNAFCPPYPLIWHGVQRRGH